MQEVIQVGLGLRWHQPPPSCDLMGWTLGEQSWGVLQILHFQKGLESLHPALNLSPPESLGFPADFGGLTTLTPTTHTHKYGRTHTHGHTHTYTCTHSHTHTSSSLPESPPDPPALAQSTARSLSRGIRHWWEEMFLRVPTQQNQVHA